MPGLRDRILLRAEQSAIMDKSSLEALIKWLEIWSAVFGVVVVLGVAGESFFGIRLLWNSWKLQRLQMAESEVLRSDVAQANARAAEANRKAEEEKVARLKIEAQLAPRQLSSHQEDVIVRFMRQYKDAPLETATMIDVCAYGPDPEAMKLANQIVGALAKSGCKVTRDQPGESGRAPLGILVEFRGGGGSQWMYIAAGLVAALRQAGLFVLPAEEMEFLEGPSHHVESPIRVTVGKR